MPTPSAATTRSFEAAGYQPVGDFGIPEMEGVWLRAFWHPDLETFAALTDHPETPLFVDLVRLFKDRGILTVTTAPDTGLDYPGYVTRVRSELDPTQLETIGRLHERLVDHSEERDAVRKQPASFATVFLQLYTLEMDWRIGRGGPSREEILRIAELSEMERPDDSAVCVIQTAWRAAIETFVDEQVQQAFLAAGGISAAEWERKRDDLSIVHEIGSREDRIDELAAVLSEAGSDPADEEDDDAEERAYVDARERVAACFEGRSIREGFRAALTLMPEKARYQPLGSVEGPWPADLYFVPDLYGSGVALAQ